MAKNLIVTEISLWDSITRKISISAITGYQKYISPYKGFACAHRVLYDGESCSQYVKRVITEEGLNAALSKSRLRFKQCKQANLILKSQTESQKQTVTTNPDRKKAHKLYCQERFNPDGIDCCELGCDCPDIVDLTPDCSSLDCGGLDCGGCG